MSTNFSFEMFEQFIEMGIARKYEIIEGTYCVEILGVDSESYYKGGEKEAYELAFRSLKQKPALASALARYMLKKDFVKNGMVCTSYEK